MAKRITVFLALCVLVAGQIRSQESHDRVVRAIAADVILDSVVIVASRSDFDVEDFIELVRQDNSLHNAFRNLRAVSCDFATDMQLAHRNEKKAVTYRSSNQQFFRDNCRSMELISEEIDGKYYKGKKQKLRFYTAELYTRVFVTERPLCTQAQAKDASNETQQEDDLTGGRIDELKTLIFSPGERAEVPFIADKTEMFSESMVGLYDYSITSSRLNEQEVYVFKAEVKPGSEVKSKATVFKSLVTVFSKSDFQVVARTYSLRYNHALFQFDVNMDVQLDVFGGKYYPTQVSYDGTWNIATKKRESGQFVVRFEKFRNE